MKKRNFLVAKFARNVEIVRQDLRRTQGIGILADDQLGFLSKEVSPILYGMISQHLLGFNEDIQLAMAENIVIFARKHKGFTTGCPSVDMVLDVIYTWIAVEHDIMKPEFEKAMKVFER